MPPDTLEKRIQHYHESRFFYGLHLMDARFKLALLCTAVAMNIYFAEIRLSIFLFLLGTALAAWSRIPVRLFLLFFILPAWSTAVVILGFSAGFGVTPAAVLGPVTFYQEGFQLGLSAAARVACDMSWMAAVFLTTPFNALLNALKWFRVPVIFLETLAMGYRYISLLMNGFHTMRHSAQVRGGLTTYRHKLRTTSRILAQVFLRSYDRAVRIQEAMVSRGEYAGSNGGTNPVQTDPFTAQCPNQCDITPDYKNASLPVVSCSSLSHYLSGTVVLKDISFTVDKNELVVLCGANGAGKTTLLKLLSGIETPTRGRIYLEGQLLDKKMRNHIFRHVGFLCQDPDNQLFCTHVREDVSYGPANLNFPPEMVTRLTDTAMELMGISDLADRPIHRLSYGQMKRVGLAGLIAMKPPLLLLDEPFANLDPAASRQLVHHLRHLNGHHGYTIIVVTHDMNLAARLARRIIILDNGRMVADNDARSILTDAPLLRRSRLETPILTRMFQRILTDPTHCSKIPLTIDEAILFLQNHSICRSPASAIDTPFIQSDDLFTDSNREDI